MSFTRSPLFAALSILFVVDQARAQHDPAAAQALFDDARGLMNKGDFAAACPKLAESQRLDPGIGTQFHLADCYEKMGRIASAWVTFLDVASLARANGQADRETAAQARAQKLEGRLPKLAIVVPAAVRVPGLEVQRDGNAVGEVQWGSSLPIDPGNHEIVVSAPGKRQALYQVRAEEGKAQTFEVPALVDEAASTTAAAAVSPAASDEAQSSTERASANETGSSTKAWQIGFAALGVVGLGVGTTYAIMANSKNEESKDYCLPEDPNQCEDKGIDLRNDALAQGNIASVAFGVGTAALVTVGVLWLMDEDSPSTASTALRVGAVARPGGALVVGGGRF